VKMSARRNRSRLQERSTSRQHEDRYSRQSTSSLDSRLSKQDETHLQGEFDFLKYKSSLNKLFFRDQNIIQRWWSWL